MYFYMSTPAEEGISEKAILDMVGEWEKQDLGIHSYMLIRHGKCISKSWWAPYRPEFCHMLNSSSKSFAAIGILFAIQEGLMSPDDYVVSYFPEELKGCEVCYNIKKLQIKHLLAMCSGQAPSESDEMFIHFDDDPLMAILTAGCEKEPGSRFYYHTAMTYLLSKCFTKRTSENLYEYMKPKFFEPLGISSIDWENDKNGAAYAGFGLKVKTEDLAKMGQFLLNRGVWEGKRLLSAYLIDEATGRRINNSGYIPVYGENGVLPLPEDECRNDWNSGYGWQFWRCRPEGIYRADGAGAQYSIVMPMYECVLAVTAGSSDMQGVLNVVWDKLLPGIADGPLTPDEDVYNSLRKAENSRTIAIPAGYNESAGYNGKRYVIVNRQLPPTTYKHTVDDLKTAAFTLKANGVFEIESRSGVKYHLDAGYGCWKDNVLNIGHERTFPFFITPFPEISAAYAWEKPDRMLLTLVCNRYMYVYSLVFDFNDDKVTITVTRDRISVPLIEHGMLDDTNLEKYEL